MDQMVLNKVRKDKMLQAVLMPYKIQVRFNSSGKVLEGLQTEAGKKALPSVELHRGLNMGMKDRELSGEKAQISA